MDIKFSISSAKNKAIVDKYIKKYFYRPINPTINEIEDKLIKILKISLKNTGLKLKNRQSIISIGSTTRNTYLEDSIDFDLSAKLDETSAALFKMDNSLYPTLLGEVKKNLQINGFEYESITNLGLVKSNTLYIFFFENLKHKESKYFIKKLDIILHLSNFINIAQINMRIISEEFKKIEFDLGSSIKEDLLSQIRFTKYLFKQQRVNIDENGSIKHPITREIIGYKGGLVSVLVEKALLDLSEKDEAGKYRNIGSFDKLMSSIFEADKNYRLSLPANSKRFIPLEIAKCLPSIAKIKQLTTLRELDKARKKAILPPHLENMDERIFRYFRSESKWYLLVRMVRDYFESDEFEKKYLSCRNCKQI